MAQNTNLNVTPYYGDFDKSKNFYRVLFRPGFPIQARELTQSQSLMQNQIENMGSHTFKDGAMVIPGQIGYDKSVDCILLQESFLGADVESYRSQLDGKIITGLTSGVKAQVLYSISATESEKGYITIYVKYIESGGTANNQTTFSNNEQLVTESDITFGSTLIEVGSPFAQLLPTASILKGSVAYVQPGVYFIRGFFVDVPYQYILLDQYGTSPKYRIGLEILESIVTPEDDLSLNDNAAGTSNYAAPGAHRFRITTNLIKKLLTDDADKDFIELLRINGDKIEKLVDRTAFGELEKSLALRTYEESGDYVVQDFQISMRDNLNDGFNNGVYTAGETTSGGFTAAENLYSIEIGPGTAYVRGYRIKTMAPTYVDLEKPRDTNSQQNTNIGFTLGNYSHISNLYGFPNVSGSTISNAYQTVELHDEFTATPGDAQGNIIGYARVSSCEFVQDPNSTFGDADDRYKLNLFDIQMITVVQIASSKTVSQGSVLTGMTSGAKGYIISATTSSHFQLYQVEGTFQKGESLLLDGEVLDVISNTHVYQYSDARQLVARDESTQAIEFTSDLRLDDAKIVQGATFTYDATGGSEKITGLQSNFAADLRPGDRIYFSATTYVTVDFITPSALGSGNTLTIFDYSAQTVNVTPPGSNYPSAGTYTTLIRYRSKLVDTLDSSLLSQMPKPYIKSISDESMVCRRTFDAQTVASDSVSITLPENEQFEAITNENYTLTVMGGTNGTYPIGDQLPIDTANSGALGYTTFTSADKTTIQIDNLTNITSIKVTATVSKNVTARKTKAAQQMFVMKVNKTISNKDKLNYGLTYSNLYGTRIEDRELSLGLMDGYKIHAIYESLDQNDPIVPSITLVEPTFFATGTVVTGKTSKARAMVVDFNTSTLKLTIIYLDGNFVSGETVEGTDSNNLAISGIINDAVGSIIEGSKVITDRYVLENGQTDFFYGPSKLVRRKGFATPIRKLKIVLDYYSHSATGDYFGGQSYLNTDYKDVTIYGEKFLADYLDFRPGCKNLYTGTGSVSSPAFVNCSTFDFKSRVFPTSGTPSATLFDVPKINSNFKCDIDWYLRRIDKIYILPNGEFQIIKGKSAEIPLEPEGLQDGMQLAVLRHKPYGFEPADDVTIIKSDNKRFTMRDIGAIEKRLGSVEYYTSLNMLETDTFNVEITDASGKNRLKNGFIVDDFTDHSKSLTKSQDWAAALDFSYGLCRPSHYTTNVSLVVNDSLSQNYQKTGPIITLPYEEEPLIIQPYASRVENVNPFNVFAYIGRIDLTPASDDWVETNRVPQNVQNLEGDFESTAASFNVDQNGFAPTQWGSWQTTWTGEQTTSTGRWNSGQPNRLPGGWGRAVMETTRVESVTNQTRSGIRTRVVPRIDRINAGDQVLSSTSIPWIRSRNVDVNVVRMKPRTSFFVFFDGQRVDAYLTPKIIEVIKDSTVDSRTNSTPFVEGETVTGLTSGCKLQVAAPNDYFTYNPYDDTELPSSYASTTNFINVNTESLAAQAVGEYFGNVQVGEVLEGASGARAVVKDRRCISDRRGQYRASFFIPDAGIDTNPRWATGTRLLRFTTNENDSRLPGTVDSAAQVEYRSTGSLNTVQEVILSIRNAEVTQDTQTQSQSITTTIREETRQVGWWDPLAQSFLVDEEGGTFITSVDIYFASKDVNIPISMQVRTMENGYPTTTILPFSDTTLTPEQVQISETGAVATRFTFRAPVYIPQSQEHCFVLFSDSNTYKVWISRMGELDITGDRTISEQPYAGVLFKSQNATTWTADQYEDMKFIVNRAVFNTSVASRLTLNNAPLDRGNRGKIILQPDAIQTFQPELQLVMNSTTLPFSAGARVYQKTTLAEGTIKSVASSAGGVLLTINDISGTWSAGSNTGGVISNRLVSSKTLATMTVTGASGDFSVGETITGNSATSPTAEVVTWTPGTNTLTLKYVSTDFTASTETITGGESSVTATVNVITYSGDVIEGGAVSDAFPSTSPTYTSAQRKVKVFHSNHGMHDNDNNVTLADIASEVSTTYLTSSISAADTSIQVNDGTAFHTIINGGTVGTANVGYIKIDDEIISYSAISGDGKTITAYERGVDGTTAVTHSDDSTVHCYNLDGIPLPELNKTHAAILSPTLDSYELTTNSIARLGIKSGGNHIEASQNIQYEVLTPQIQKLILPKTSVDGTVNTISGTSIGDGQALSQNSFSNTGEFFDVVLNDYNEFLSPQLICSQINESAELSGSKSFRLDLTLKSEKENVSPIIDTDRMSIILTSNRINSPTNINSALLPVGDEHEAVYITKIATLTNPSGAIKLMFSATRPPDTHIKPLYRVLPAGSTDNIETLGWEFFPTGGDSVIPATTDEEVYRDYGYEISGLDFTQYQIKILFVSQNQASVPKIMDLRAIALAI